MDELNNTAETTGASAAYAGEDVEVEYTTIESDISVETEQTSGLTEITFEPTNFVDNLHYMGTGMLGIFIVIGLIWFVTFALNKLFSGKKKDETSDEQ